MARRKRNFKLRRKSLEVGPGQLKTDCTSGTKEEDNSKEPCLKIPVVKLERISYIDFLALEFAMKKMLPLEIKEERQEFMYSQGDDPENDSLENNIGATEENPDPETEPRLSVRTDLLNPVGDVADFLDANPWDADTSNSDIKPSLENSSNNQADVIKESNQPGSKHLSKDYVRTEKDKGQENTSTPCSKDRLHCADCSRGGDCSEHGPLFVVKNRPVPPNITDLCRAKRTLPILLIFADSQIPDAGSGVWAREDIPARTRFGPFEGQILPAEFGGSAYSWVIRRNGEPLHCIDATEPGLSNWMRYVNCARNLDEQNLEAFQYDDKLYFKTMRKIVKNEELLVWYGEGYGRHFEADPFKSSQEMAFGYSACSVSCASSVVLTEHESLCKYARKIEHQEVFKEILSKVEVKEETSEDIVPFQGYLLIDAVKTEIPEAPVYDDYPADELEDKMEIPEVPFDDGFTEEIPEDVSTLIIADVRTLVPEDIRTEPTDHVRTVSTEDIRTEKPEDVKTETHNDDQIVMPANLRDGDSESSFIVVDDEETLDDDRTEMPVYIFDDDDCEEVSCDVRTEVLVDSPVNEDSSDGVKECSALSRSSKKERHSRPSSDGGSEHSAPSLSSMQALPSDSVSDRGSEYSVPSLSSKKRLPSCSVSDGGSEYSAPSLSSKNRSFPCPVCKRLFSRNSRLSKHLLKHNKKKPYVCSTCKKCFSTISELKTHERMHSSLLFACSLCSSRFSRSSHLKYHVRVIHSDESPAAVRPYPCTACPKRCSSKRRLQAHFRVHLTVPKRFSCPYCEKSTHSSSRFKEHLKTHTGEKPFACNQCDKRYAHAGSLIVHKRDHPEEHHVCGECNKSFSRADHLSKHKQLHTIAKSHTCPVCKLEFKTAAALNNHNLSHEKDKSSPYVCPHCKKRFHDLSNWTNHQRTHSGPNRVSCPVCKKDYDKAYLLVHMQVHSGARPFKCSHCDRTFSRKHSLKDHVRTHTGEKPYICKVCDRRFALLTSLKCHAVTHDKNRSVKCNECDKTYSARSTLLTHIKTYHQGIKPFTCSFEGCEQQYSRRVLLEDHIRSRHTGEKPFLCTICNEQFYSKQILRDHTKRKHGRSFDETVETVDVSSDVE